MYMASNYNVTRWLVGNIISVCTQTVPAFSNKNMLYSGWYPLVTIEIETYFYPLLRLFLPLNYKNKDVISTL